MVGQCLRQQFPAPRPHTYRLVSSCVNDVGSRRATDTTQLEEAFPRSRIWGTRGLASPHDDGEAQGDGS